MRLISCTFPQGRLLISPASRMHRRRRLGQKIHIDFPCHSLTKGIKFLLKTAKFINKNQSRRNTKMIRTVLIEYILHDPIVECHEALPWAIIHELQKQGSRNPSSLSLLPNGQIGSQRQWYLYYQ